MNFRGGYGSKYHYYWAPLVAVFQLLSLGISGGCFSSVHHDSVWTGLEGSVS
jgi:hypothetical protein